MEPLVPSDSDTDQHTCFSRLGSLLEVFRNEKYRNMNTEINTTSTLRYFCQAGRQTGCHDTLTNVVFMPVAFPAFSLGNWEVI